MKSWLIIISLLGLGVGVVSAQTKGPTWVDSMDSYARHQFLPPNKYRWTWQNAALLNTMVKQYYAAPDDKKQVYFDYIKACMDKAGKHANGKVPNAVASGLGMAFLYKETHDERYLMRCEKIYDDYLRQRRTREGAISHIPLFKELWDDTIFMIGEFLLNMYQATGDDKYLNELVNQITLHRDKLRNAQWGLWVHGYDQKQVGHCMFCSQIHWVDKTTHRSPEMWGRGNGWIVVTLSDALQVIPKTDPRWNLLAGYLKEMVEHLPELQDPKTGHWYQLPARNTDPGNFIESSCTAMFAYGIDAAVNLGIVGKEPYTHSVDLAYKGLRQYSVVPVGKGYLTSSNVCKATCIGNKKYYFKRGVTKGKSYGLGSFILFGSQHEREHGLKIIK